MVEIRNLKFQPLTLHLANSKRSVHLRPRGRTEIEDKDVSAEMRRAADRGFIALGQPKSQTPSEESPPPAAPRPAPPAKTEPKKGPAPKPQAPDKNTEERR
jgi:hypothetical protein